MVVVNLEKSKTKIPDGTYYPEINILDNDVWLSNEQTDLAKNTIKIENREYNFRYIQEKTVYANNEDINFNALVVIKTPKTVNSRDNEDIYAKISIKDANLNVVSIPNGAKALVNANAIEIINGVIQTKLIDNITSKNITQELNLNIDMSEVLKQNRLAEGNYYLVVDIYSGIDESLSNSIKSQTQLPITITLPNEEKYSYGIQSEIINDNGLPSDKLQLIENTQEETRTISVKYSGNLPTPQVNIKTVERV